MRKKTKRHLKFDSCWLLLVVSASLSMREKGKTMEAAVKLAGCLVALGKV